jgi:hypothetical protein
MVLWYNDEVQFWDEHKREYFQLKVILFVTVSDSPTACNLLGQRKKVGYRCPHCFRETDSVFERVKKTMYIGHQCYIPMKHRFRNMNDQFNGKAEKRCPPPHLIGHEVYEMVKNVLGK